MPALQGKMGLMKGKSEIQRQWKLLEALQVKHKKIQEGGYISFILLLSIV